MRGSHPIRVDPIEEIVKPTLHMLAGVSERERSFLEFTSEATNLWKKLDIEGWFGELEVAGEITLSERHRAELCNAITDYEDQLPERVELRRVQIENATKACKSAAEACRVANDALLPLQFSFSPALNSWVEYDDMAVALLRVAASLKKTKGRKPRHDHFITCAVNVFHDAGGRVAFSGNSPWERFLSKLWELLPTSRPKRASALIRRAERMELRKKFPWRQDHWIIFTAKAFHDAGGRVAFSGNSTFSGNSPWERLLRRVWEKMPPTARPETASALVRRAKQLSKKLPGCEADVHAFEEFISELKVHLRRGEVRG